MAKKPSWWLAMMIGVSVGVFASAMVVLAVAIRLPAFAP